MSERTMQALRGRINARLQTSAISRDRASAAGREVVAQCRQSDVETLEWVLSEIDALLRTPRGEGEPVAYMVTASRYSGGGVEWVGDWLFRGPAECEEHVRWLHRPQSRWQDVRVTPLYAALRPEAQGEVWQVTEPARDIVRREMPETRATVREAIRAARRGEGGGE